MIDILRIEEDFENDNLPIGMYFRKCCIHIKNGYAYYIDSINIDYGSEGFEKYKISNKDIYYIDNGMWEDKIINGHFNIKNNRCFDFIENLILNRPFQVQVYQNDNIFSNRIHFENCAFNCNILMDPDTTYLTSNCKWRDE